MASRNPNLEANRSSAGSVAAKAMRQRFAPHPRSRQMPGAGKRETLGAVSQACKGIQEAHGTSEITETTVPTFSIGSKKEFVLNGQINGVSVSILVDTGAAATVLSKDVWDLVNTDGAELEPVGVGLVGVQGSPLQLHGSTQQQLCVQGDVFPVKMIVADSVMTDVILGRDFLKTHQCTVDLSEDKDVLYFKDRGVVVALGDIVDSQKLAVLTLSWRIHYRCHRTVKSKQQEEFHKLHPIRLG